MRFAELFVIRPAWRCSAKKPAALWTTGLSVNTRKANPPVGSSATLRDAYVPNSVGTTFHLAA